jgi:hypothetical protein
VVVADIVSKNDLKWGKSMLLATGAASRRLIAIGAPGQSDFAHVVSTNYSQYKMWCFEVSVYNVKTEQDVGIERIVKREWDNL